MPPRQPGLAEFVALMSTIMAMIAMSIDGLLPALGRIGHELGVVNPNDTQFVITLFFFGMVFGEVVFGPVSDAIGRKRAILVGIAIYIFGSAICMMAGSMEELIVGRVIQGIGVSGPKCASRALIRDIYRGDAMARIMSLVFMVFILVPMIAPAIGQLVADASGWRTIFAGYLAIAVGTGVWLAVRQPETLTPDRRIPLRLPSLAENAGRVLRHGRVMAYTVAVGLVFGALVVYISTCQAMFSDLYGIERRFPLYFAILSIGVGFSSFLNSRLVIRYGMERMTLAAFGLMLTFAALEGAIAAAHGGIPPFSAFMVLTFLMFTCLGMLFGNLNALAMDWLGGMAGLGSALVASVSSLVAVVMSIGLGRLYDGTAMVFVAGFLIAGTGGLALTLLARRQEAVAL